MKIQINLYDHREVDRIITKNLGLDKTTNVNSLVKDLLYKLALSMNNDNVNVSSNKVKQVEVKTEKPVITPKTVETHQDKLKTSNKDVLFNSVKSLNIY